MAGGEFVLALLLCLALAIGGGLLLDRARSKPATGEENWADQVFPWFGCFMGLMVIAAIVGLIASAVSDQPQGPPACSIDQSCGQ